MRRGLALFGFIALLVAAGANAQGPQVGGPLPPPLPLFPPDNWWNVRVTDAPLDARSDAFIQFIGATRALHPDFGGDADTEPEIYGIPYVTVPGTQPLVPVTFEYDDESDAGAPGRLPGYPIPEEAKTQPRWIEGGYPATGGDGDRHMLIVDRDNRLLFELFATHWNASRGRWEAGSGAAWSLDSNHRRPEGWTSADAAGLAILPGLVRYDEVYGLGEIAHAFRVTVRATNGYVYPASHRAGSTAGALPMGARLRLKRSKDISGFAEPVRKIFQAFKDYGLIVADNGSDMYVTGTYDTRWDNDLLNPAFRSLRAGDFEVIELGWNPAAAPTCIAPAVTRHPQSTTVAAGASVTLHVAFTGTPPVAQQWYRGVQGDTRFPITAATGDSITVSPLSTERFWARATNACGVADSAAATVTVVPACDHPAVVTQPASVTVTRGSSVTLRAQVAGTGPMSYQWYSGARGDMSRPHQGATSDALLLNAVRSTSSYWLRAANSCGEVFTDAATVTVKSSRNRPVRRP